MVLQAYRLKSWEYVLHHTYRSGLITTYSTAKRPHRVHGRRSYRAPTSLTGPSFDKVRALLSFSWTRSITFVNLLSVNCFLTRRRPPSGSSKPASTSLMWSAYVFGTL